MGNSKVPIDRKFVNASKSSDGIQEAGDDNNAKGRATGLRIIAVISWLIAIAFEFLVIVYINGTLYLPGNQTMWLIIGIGADLVFVLIGSLVWKTANRIDPASEKNKLRFFLWNNMGVIAAIVAFVPLIIVLLRDKKLNPKTRKIFTAIAAVVLVIAMAVSYDYNPVSQEDLSEAKQASTELGNGTTYWTMWGHSYHFDPNCRTLLNSTTIYQGTIEQAFEAKRTDPCNFCAGGETSIRVTSGEIYASQPHYYNLYQ